MTDPMSTDLFMSAPLTPVLATGALQFAFEKATLEGKLTIGRV